MSRPATAHRAATCCSTHRMSPWGAAGHEIMHALGQADHTFDDSGTPVSGCTWCKDGEYKDPYDIMSYASSGYPTTQSFTSGTTTTTLRAWPELNTAYRNQLGYLPASRTLTLNHGPASITFTVSLAAVERPEG